MIVEVQVKSKHTQKQPPRRFFTNYTYSFLRKPLSLLYIIFQRGRFVCPSSRCYFFFSETLSVCRTHALFQASLFIFRLKHNIFSGIHTSLTNTYECSRRKLIEYINSPGSQSIYIYIHTNKTKKVKKLMLEKFHCECMELGKRN